MSQPAPAPVPLLDTHQHLVYPEKWPYSWTDGIPALAKRAGRVVEVRDGVIISDHRNGIAA